ncbi:MAG: CHRD domain-containing protein [Phycisphaerales bacterium]
MSCLTLRSFGSLSFCAAALTITAAASTASADIVSYDVVFSGPAESPPNASPGTGVGTVTYDSTLHTLTLSCVFSDLLGTTTNSHIHAATAVPFAGLAGVATTTPTFAGFPTGVTSGTYNMVLDLTLASSYNPAYVTANGGTPASAEAALTASFAAGTAYWNIHSSLFQGGEIRGFLTPVPSPGSAVLAAVGLGALAFGRRTRPTQV